MKRIWTLHGWLGLVFAIPFVLLSVTGAILVRYDWVERVFDRAVFRSSGAPAPAALTTLVARFAKPRPEVRIRYIEWPAAPGRNPVIFVHGSGTRRAFILDATSGTVLAERDELQGPRRWLLHLHATFWAGAVGELIVAVSSLALVLVALSGLWVYRGAWAGLFRPRFRRVLGNRVASGDLHRWTGIASLLLLLTLGFTGALLTVPGVPRLFSGPRPEPALGEPYDWSKAPPVEPMLQMIRERLPGVDADFVALPEGPNGSFTWYTIRREAWLWHKYAEVEFSGTTGTLVEIRRAADQGPLERVNALVAIFHFGHQGGELMRWVYFLGGFGPLVLAVTGTFVWWSRGRRSPTSRPPDVIRR